MVKKTGLVLALVLGVSAVLPAHWQRRVAMGDWPEARGPQRDGRSAETCLVSTWKLNG